MPSGLAGRDEALLAACGASNAMVNVEARKEDRQWYDWHEEGDWWGDPVFSWDNSRSVDGCDPDLDNAISTFIVRDKSSARFFDDGWCVRDGQGITLAELLFQFMDTHTYEQLYFSWLSCKLLIRRRLTWGSPVFVPSRVARFIASFIGSGPPFPEISWYSFVWSSHMEPIQAKIMSQRNHFNVFIQP